MTIQSTDASSSASVEVITMLFAEFKYRHENFWNILFKLSYAIAILYAAPYFFINCLQKNHWLFPALGLALSMGGTFLLALEYDLLYCIESKYNKLKFDAICEANSEDPKKPRRIDRFIYIFWGIVFAAVGIVEIVFLAVPNLVP